MRFGARKILFRDGSVVGGTRLLPAGTCARIRDDWITEAGPARSPCAAGPLGPAGGILPGFIDAYAHPVSPADAGRICHASVHPAGSPANGVARPLPADS